MSRHSRFSKSRLAILAVFGCSLFGGESIGPTDGLVVHEWGTFTSLAGPDGDAIRWQPLAGASDLPCFVFHLRDAFFKGGLGGTVRMETPVLYFHSREERDVSVKVDFPSGLITEWYPAAGKLTPAVGLNQNSGGSIEWPLVKVLPKGKEQPAPARENRASRYYVARNAGAATLLVSAPGAAQTEKFLFYRGVANFQPPLSVKLIHNAVELRNRDGEHLGPIIIFENRNGRIGYRIRQAEESRALWERPRFDSDLTSLNLDLERLLTENGLFPDEARAMLESWRDSWFEEGTRVLYLLPKSAVDRILPLAIRPAPAGIERVFVGRIELITPEIRETVLTAAKAGDQNTLAKYGRFLEPILGSLRRNEPWLGPVLESAFSLGSASTTPAACPDR